MRLVHQQQPRPTPLFLQQLELRKGSIRKYISLAKEGTQKVEDRETRIRSTLLEFRGRKERLQGEEVAIETSDFLKQVFSDIDQMAHAATLRLEVLDTASETNSELNRERIAWALYLSQFRCLLRGLVQDWQQTLLFQEAKYVIDYFAGISAELLRKTHCSPEVPNPESVVAVLCPEAAELHHAIQVCACSLLRLSQHQSAFFRAELGRLLEKVTEQVGQLLGFLQVC